MSHHPDNDKPATKADLRQLDGRIDQVDHNLSTVAHQVGVLTRDVAEVRTTMATKEDINALRVEMADGHKALSAEMADGHKALSAELAQHASGILGEVQKLIGVVQDQTTRSTKSTRAP